MNLLQWNLQTGFEGDGVENKTKDGTEALGHVKDRNPNSWAHSTTISSWLDSAQGPEEVWKWW